MPDILTLWNTTRGDWQRAGGSLASGNDIVTSVLISLFTDRVATPDDTVPDATRRLRDPRGWWADESIGSRLWLIDRAKRTQATLQRAQAYIVEALQWLVDDGVVSRIEVTTEWTRQDTLGALVVVYSPRTGAPLVKIGTQNVFRLPDAQAWGWNAEHEVGQWVELINTSTQSIFYTSITYPTITEDSMSMPVPSLRYGTIIPIQQDAMTVGTPTLLSGALTSVVNYISYQNWRDIAPDAMTVGIPTLLSGALTSVVNPISYQTADAMTVGIPTLLSGALVVTATYINYQNWRDIAPDAMHVATPSLLSGTLQ